MIAMLMIFDPYLVLAVAGMLFFYFCTRLIKMVLNAVDRARGVVRDKRGRKI